ncbi:MAG TPA: polyprenyl synthetase family protein [Candidatus Macondimonas sp.]|nr:polyprenyl synthetase family protein [Candidatus Macondimonas sp.]
MHNLEMIDILAPIEDDMRRMDAVLRRATGSVVPLVGEINQHIVGGGGKRLRPAVLLLAARACGYAGDEHLRLAAAVEAVHTATLLHDDVVDRSRLRRGRPTANQVWGNEASVLVGDFMYSRATQMIVESERLDIVAVLSTAANDIAEGEVVQLTNRHNPGLTEHQYFDVIRNKTARLFEASAQAGALIAHASKSRERALARYGVHLGNAFQLIDDALDFTGSVDAIGKNLGDDLADGKATLPLIHAMRESTHDEAEYIRQAIRKGSLDRLPDILSAIESTGAIEYTARLAAHESEQAIDALSALDESPFRASLAALARFAVQRDR